MIHRATSKMLSVAYIYKNKVILELFRGSGEAAAEQQAKEWFVNECIKKNLIKKPPHQIRYMLNMSLEEIVELSGIFMGFSWGDDDAAQPPSGMEKMCCSIKNLDI
jgi:hypothetical protein